MFMIIHNLFCLERLRQPAHLPGPVPHSGGGRADHGRAHGRGVPVLGGGVQGHDLEQGVRAF